ncbi:hypothetical protein DFQ27_000122 [Actinomortierella ambigua]|uniref:G domain-containing protein n=1 Tax=Actinomortierella ambigua TaxID=1343610 RepID=A0A9P6QEK8_9FUNG|nr:hypothetical protein DFQ27_000122 [Actinomortierella ambigua]
MLGNVLFIGNTGVGKSYLLNSIGGEFESGFSSVDGLTAKVSYCDVEIQGSCVRLIDAPGLLEATGERMRNNARAITDALGMPGGFKLVFVMADNSGRVTPADLYTIGRVMSAIDGSIPVGAIINKVPEEELDLYDDSETKEKIIRQLNSVAPNCFGPARFKAIPRFSKNNIHGAADLVKELLRDMDFHLLPAVKSITASMEELRGFTSMLKSLPKDAKDFVAGFFKTSCETHGNAHSDRQNKSMYHKDAMTQDPKATQGVLGAERQAGHDQLGMKNIEAINERVTAENSDEHPTRSAQPNGTSLGTQLLEFVKRLCRFQAIIEIHIQL